MSATRFHFFWIIAFGKCWRYQNKCDWLSIKELNVVGKKTLEDILLQRFPYNLRYIFIFPLYFWSLGWETLESLQRQNTLWRPVSMWRDTIILHRYLSKIEHSFSHSVFITGKPVFCSNETGCGFEQNVTCFCVCVCVREGGDTHREGERNRINPRGRWKHITVGGNKHIHTPELPGLQESKW